MRFFAEVSYDGTSWHGWQIQNNAPTVQGTIEEKLSIVLREKVEIVGSGRTDAGVHCIQQFFHVDSKADLSTDDFLYKINSFLPESIAIRQIIPVKDEAHARFDAISREYKYKIVTKKDPFSISRSLYFGSDLNVGAMNKCCKLLVGEKDFESFSKVKTDVNTFVCNIFHAEWVEKDSQLQFTISANRFLRGMVRAIVGTLLDVGSGKINELQFGKIIEEKDRKKAGHAVEACGLYLNKVLYPDDIFIKK